jgi:hypothetical protein
MLAEVLTLGFFSSCLLASSLGQSPQGVVLNGAVILNEVGGTPLVGVSVSADGANDTKTVAGGKFRLQFPYKKVGGPVEVRVTRPGYVVVNWIQQTLNLPSSSKSEQLTLIICKESEREAWARSFYRLKGDDAVEATYQARLHELEESNRKNASEVAKLQQERDQARAAAEEAAAGFALVKPGDATDLYAGLLSRIAQGTWDLERGEEQGSNRPHRKHDRTPSYDCLSAHRGNFPRAG